MGQGVISELVIYPVKSLQGISVQSAELSEQGLKWDRYWMIVNEDGQFATQRHFSPMATIQTKITDTHLVLSHPEHEDFCVALDASDQVLADKKQVKIWNSECIAVDEGLKVSLWLTKVLGLWRGQRLSLVRMSPDFERKVSDNHTNGASNTTLFSDGYPYLITTTASLAQLNSRLQQNDKRSIPMSRFRANVIVDNTGFDSAAFIEHRSDRLVVEKTAVEFNLCKPCERCKVPSIDQVTGMVESPKQPLKTLFAMEHVKQKGAFFGHNAVLTESTKAAMSEQNSPVIKVGDKVQFVP